MTIMTEADRNELIDAYFDALDNEDLSIVEPVLDESFVYESTAGVLEGFAGLQRYANELRTTSDSTHTVNLRIHSDDATATEGIVTGLDPDGNPKEGNFCDVFEFTEADDAITRIAVYVKNA